jgi:hypothetical protein
MPNDVTGFTGDEIVEFVKNFIGNQSSEFESFLEQLLPLAEHRYCKGHDWSFLRKQNLSLTVATGTAEYTLSAANIGFYMSSSDVETIFSVANNRELKKTTLNQIRKMDSDQNDGNTSSGITHWAPSGDNKIVVYPAIFNDTTLKIDGKIRPTALSTLSNYPTVPYHYQDAFIQYIISWALFRENDDRAASHKMEVAQLIRQDIQDDMRNLGDDDSARIKHADEAVAKLLEFDALNMRG